MIRPVYKRSRVQSPAAPNEVDRFFVASWLAQDFSTMGLVEGLIFGFYNKFS